MGRSRLVLAAASLCALLGSAQAAQAAPVAVTHSGWFWGNPQPQGNNLTEIAFAGGRGYAGGQFGTLVRTDDGGETWSGLRTGLTDDLRRVRVVNPDTVVIAGSCALRRTDDGGQSFARLPWTASDEGCPSRIASIHFPNPDTGYVLTEDSSVFRTADGGQTFSRATSVPGPAAATDIFFTSGDTGVATTGGSGSGKIYRTTDSGNSWTEVESIGSPLNGLLFLAGGSGFAVGDGKTLLTSADGGVSWTPQPLSGPSGSPNLTSISCADPLTCLITESNGETLLRTTDGGATATSVTPSTQSIFAVGFSSASRAVAAGQLGATVVSDDAGMTWSPIGDRISGSNFTRLRATSPAVAHASGAAGTIARTVDGGVNWFTVGVPTTQLIQDAFFVNQDLGFALDRSGSAFKTTNGGSSWQILNTGTSQAPQAILALSETVALLVGPTGVRRSADGGNTFEAVTDKDLKKGSLFDVDPAGSAVVAFGTKTLRGSSDGGETWRKMALPSRRSRLQAIDFLDSRTGYAVTSDGRLWSTTNGGRKWKDVPSIGTGEAFDVSFSAPATGYLSVVGSSAPVNPFGGNGLAYRTTDGGRTWQPQLIDRDVVTIVDAGATGFANNVAGDFFATTTGGQGAMPSSLTIRKGSAASASRRIELKKKGKVKVAGTLTPPEGGESIVVSIRPIKKSGWVQQEVTAASNGEFTATFSVKKPSYVVAQWTGDDVREGAGSTALKVKPPKKKKKK
jgi:photosystem II stability/assembly factor-like uncharacterized protein